MTDQYFDFLNPENNSSGDASDSRYVENRVVNNDRYESTGYRHADNGAIPPEPVPGKKKKGGFFKRAAALVLSGIVVGGIAAGVFIGSAYAARQSGLFTAPQQEVPKIPATVTKTENEGGNSAGAGVNIMDASGIVSEVMPSIVAITNTQIYENYNSGNYNYYDFFNYFFGQQGQQGQQNQEPQEYTAGSGSGIIVSQNDTELLIATNNHVIEGASSLTITFEDDSTAPAYVKGTDEEADLAVVAVKFTDLSAETRAAIKIATLGSSDEVKVGQGVIAIGNAMGYGQAVTGGFISALNREVVTSDGITRTLLQTDAAINPGNSGGALVNMKGEVIGINSAKLSDTKVEGIGYAIPISAAEGIITDLMNRQTREVVTDSSKQAYLGIVGVGIDSSTASVMNMPEGVVINNLVEGAPINDADVLPRDVITKFDGQKVRSTDDIKELLQYYEGGSQVELTLERLENGDYVEHTVTVTLGYASSAPADNSNR